MTARDRRLSLLALAALAFALVALVLCGCTLL